MNTLADCHLLNPRTTEDGVLELTFDSPATLNAVSEEMHAQLAAVWRLVDQDASVRAVLVRAEGRAFSAGGDLDWVEKLTGDFEDRARGFREARDLVWNVVNCRKPVVAAINGVAVGAGLAVALLADIAIAGESAKLLDGHTRIGVAAGDHAVLSWPIACGLARAKYHLLLCDPIDGTTAAEIGLVARCVPDENLEAEARLVAHRLASGSTTAIRWTKHTLNHWLRQAMPAFEASLAAEFLGFTGPDALEGITAVREKRQPRFTGPSDD